MGRDLDPEELLEDEWEDQPDKNVSLRPPHQYEIKMLWNTGHEALLSVVNNEDLQAVERAYLSALRLTEKEIATLQRLPSSIKIREQRIVEIFYDGELVVFPPKGAWPSSRQQQPEVQPRKPHSYATVTLRNGKSASLVPVTSVEELLPEVRLLHHTHGRETAVLIGEPFDQDAGKQDALQRLCACIMKTLWGMGEVLIDQVRSTMLSSFLDQSYQSLKESPLFVCAGIAYAGTAKVPNEVPVYHKDIFLVPGTPADKEVPWLAALTSAFAEQHDTQACNGHLASCADRLFVIAGRASSKQQ